MAVGHFTRKEIDYVMATDDAIDYGKTEVQPSDIDNQKSDGATSRKVNTYQAYVKAGYDLTRLKLKSGESPTVWRLRRPNRNARRRFKSFLDEDGRASLEGQEFLLRVGLVSVKNYRVTGEGERVTRLPAVQHEKDDEYGPMVTLEWLEEANLPDGYEEVIYWGVRSLIQAQIPFCKGSATPSTAGE